MPGQCQTLKLFNVLLEDPRCEEAFKIAIGQRSACGIPRPSFFEQKWRYKLSAHKRATYSRYSLYIKYGRKKGDGSVRVGYFSIGTPPKGTPATIWKQAPTLPRTDQTSQTRKSDTLIINSPDDKRAPKRKVVVLIDSTGMPYPVDTNGTNHQSELNLGKKARPVG